MFNGNQTGIELAQLVCASWVKPPGRQATSLGPIPPIIQKITVQVKQSNFKNK